MSDRRSFLKATLALSAGALALRTGASAAAEAPAPGYPANVLYTAANPGVWAGKEGSHAPIVTVEGRKVTVLTKHGMSEEHFIVRHTLISHDGKVLGAKTFTPKDETAQSEYELPEGYKGRLIATSFCNKHDFWLSEAQV